MTNFWILIFDIDSSFVIGNLSLSFVMFQKYFQNISVIFFCLFFPANVFAMSSQNYKIDADVIGAAGGLGTSANYKLTDTVGEPVIGIGQSANYKTQAGFWYMVNYVISLQVDSNTVNLGTLTPGTPVTGQSVITVMTDSWGGYDLLTSQNHSMTHTNTVTTIPEYSCAIGSPCLWSGIGLGFTVKAGTGVNVKWGSNPSFKYAYFPLADTIFHQKAGYTSGADQTTVEYKLDVATSQRSGNYSNIITYTAMPKL